MEFQSSQLFKLLDYPKGDLNRGKELYKELLRRGVKGLTFIAKGYRGVVFKGIYRGLPVAIKVKRSDSAKESLTFKEYQFLKHLEGIYGKETPAPIPYFVTQDFIVMEWVEGIPFKDALLKEPREAVVKGLECCYRLDRAKVEHSEIKGEKHLIFSGDRVRVIDFESGKFKERPRNLLQFLGYHVIGKGLFKELGVEKEELFKAISLYKEKPEDGFTKLRLLFDK